MEAKVYDIQGREKGTTQLEESVFRIKPNKSAIYYALRAELANKRQGTASTRSRSEVKGSGRKPWRQKGTGRARAGTRRSPIWTGGGVAFGPRPRDYRIRVPRKIKRLSLRSVLSQKVSENLLKVVEDFTVESGKTRDFHNIAVNLSDESTRDRVVIIDRDRNPLNRRAERNIPWVRYFDAVTLTTGDILYATQLILTESAVKALNETYGEKTKAAPSGARAPESG